MAIEGREIKCERVSFNQMHNEYYDAMGWDMDGVPKESTVKDLNLVEIVSGK
jgi:aldehyde:ferredoxin oxidoreductase